MVWAFVYLGAVSALTIVGAGIACSLSLHLGILFTVPLAPAAGELLAFPVRRRSVEGRFAFPLLLRLILTVAAYPLRASLSNLYRLFDRQRDGSFAYDDHRPPAPCRSIGLPRMWLQNRYVERH